MTILSTDLVKQFVESTHDETETKEPSRFYGTASVRPDGIYVILDGSTIPTPVSMATDAQTGDRVLVEIVNHQARVIQNINKSNSDIVAGRIEHDETGVFQELRVGKEYVNTLIASDITADSIVADRAKIEDLEAENVTINNKLTVAEADIKTLETTKLSAEDADIRYLNVDFSKIDKAWLQEFYAQSGIIKDLVIGESTVTGHLVGVTISGDLIEGNTVKADKLVIKGEDGLYYKLNIEGGSTVTEQLTKEMLQNGLDGNNIIANTITAEKISVDDLIAFDATIGGFNIGSNSIYSGVKSSIDNTTRGIYMDTDGQVYFGDSTNYLKYYKDTDNTYKLEVSAKSILFGSTGSSVEDTINEIKSDATTAKADAAMAQTAANNAQSSIDNLEIGGRNLLQIGNLGRYKASKVTEDIVNVEVEGYTFTATGDPTDLIGFIVPVESGDITISGKTGLVSQTIYYTVYDSNDSVVQTQRNSHTETKDGRFILMLTMPSGASELHIGFGYYPYSSASGDYTLSNIKIEKGNKTTDWTPAPEDVDDSIESTSSVAYEAKESIENLEIGGRNLFLNTGETVSNNNYKVSEYAPANGSLKAGETYTATICVTPAENLTEIVVHFSLGYIAPVRFHPNGTGKQVISGTFTMKYYDGKTPDVHPSYAYAQLYRFPNDGTVTGNTTVHWFKIEKGNKATDWTPAPEDIDSRTTVLEAASAKELVRNGFASFTTAPSLTLGKTTSAWKVVVTNDGIFLRKSFNDVASLSKETSSEETTLRADNARLANVKFRSANGGGKLGIVAQSNGHVSLKEI